MKLLKISLLLLSGLLFSSTNVTAVSFHPYIWVNLYRNETLDPHISGQVFDAWSEKGIKASCARSVNRYAKFLIPSQQEVAEKIIDDTISDKNAFTISVPHRIAEHGKITVSKRDAVKIALGSVLLANKIKNEGAIATAKDIGLDAIKDTIIGSIRSRLPEVKMSVPECVKNFKYYFILRYIADKTVNGAYHLAYDEAFDLLKHRIVGK